MKKQILILSLILTCQFLTGQMSNNVDSRYKETVLSLDTLNVYLTDIDTPDEKLEIQIDTSVIYTRIFKMEADTIKAILLVSACNECPAYTIKGHVVITKNFYTYPEKIEIYLDEFKQKLPGRIFVWDYKKYKWEEN